MSSPLASTRCATPDILPYILGHLQKQHLRVTMRVNFTFFKAAGSLLYREIQVSTPPFHYVYGPQPWRWAAKGLAFSQRSTKQTRVSKVRFFRATQLLVIRNFDELELKNYFDLDCLFSNALGRLHELRYENMIHVELGYVEGRMAEDLFRAVRVLPSVPDRFTAALCVPLRWQTAERGEIYVELTDIDPDYYCEDDEEEEEVNCKVLRYGVLLDFDLDCIYDHSQRLLTLTVSLNLQHSDHREWNVHLYPKGCGPAR